MARRKDSPQKEAMREIFYSAFCASSSNVSLCLVSFLFTKCNSYDKIE